jgi:hypothetical protein
VPRHVLAVEIAGGKYLENRSQHTGRDAHAQKDLRVLLMATEQHVQRPHAGHDKGGCNDGATHRMRVLDQSPWIAEQL